MGEVPSVFVAVMLTMPLPGGAIAIMSVSSKTAKVKAGVEPKRTWFVLVKFVPIKVIWFCPSEGPVLGSIDVMEGIDRM